MRKICSHFKLKKSLLLQGIAVVGSLLFTYGVKAEGGEADISRLKAAFIYQFTNYIVWPNAEELKGPFKIYVIGSEDLRRELHEISKTKSIKGRTLEVKGAASPETAAGAEIIILISSDHETLTRTLSKIKGTNTLLVTHAEGFAHKGSMINFFIEGERLRFEINRKALEAARLNAGSQLLKLARIIP